MFGILLVLCLSWENISAQGACPSDCQCINREINCNGQNITSIPTVGRLFNYDRLDLGNNEIRRIESDAFTNFGVKEIVINNNKISTIDVNAFRDIGNTLESLDISDNMLTSLQTAFAKLDNLNELDVSGNPIAPHGFTDSIMRHLGTKLNKFKLGHPFLLSRWPTSTSHLPQLHELEINGANIGFLPPTAFHSFERTLTNLTIKNTLLTSLPLAIPRLHRLVEFHFDHNHNAGDYGILEQAFVGLTTLRTLSLRDNKLTTFPFVLSPLVNLQDLSLDDNTLLYISDEAVKYINNSRIENLRLRNCSLDRIPGSINGKNGNLLHLHLLDLSNNNIQSLDRNDLQNLTSLRTLLLAGNTKLQYISDSALSNLPNLSSLDLSDTRLTTVPEAVRHIPNLNYLNLENDIIECTCDLVNFKKHVDSSRLRTGQILGNCETISSTIRHYIDTFVVNCPAYTAEMFG